MRGEERSQKGRKDVGILDVGLLLYYERFYVLSIDNG